MKGEYIKTPEYSEGWAEMNVILSLVDITTTRSPLYVWDERLSITAPHLHNKYKIINFRHFDETPFFLYTLLLSLGKQLVSEYSQFG